MDYKSKSNDSFKSRLRFYLFKSALTNTKPNKNEFLSFDIDTNPAIEFVELYITEYQQFDPAFKISQHNSLGLDNNGLYSEIKKLEKAYKEEINSWKSTYFNEVFERKLPKNEFEKFEKEECCGYCKTSIHSLRAMMESKQIFKKNERGYNLELDRKKPNMEYSTSNCIMACYWCNNAKTDEFDDIEFESIGKAIGEVFKNRMKHDT